MIWEKGTVGAKEEQAENPLLCEVSVQWKLRVPSNFRALKLLRISTGGVEVVPLKGSFAEGVGRVAR